MRLKDNINRASCKAWHWVGSQGISFVVCCLRILGNDFSQLSLRLTGQPLGETVLGETLEGRGGRRKPPFLSFPWCSRHLTVSQQSSDETVARKLGVREVKWLPKVTQQVSGSWVLNPIWFVFYLCDVIRGSWHEQLEMPVYSQVTFMNTRAFFPNTDTACEI